MKRFLSVALVWMVFLVFAAGYLVVVPPLTAHAEQTAEADLTALTEAAFQRIALANDNYETILAAADENILAKARAVERFVAHDDTLLAPDALSSLCEMLGLYSVDVAAADGVVTASSLGADLGKNLLEDETLGWAQAVFDDPTKEYAEVDAHDNAVRIGCVPRTDTEGVLLVRGRDESVAAARDAAKPEEVLRQMSFIQDTLEISSARETFGVEDGRYVVRRTQDGVTVEASRELSRVYTIRNAATLILAVMLVLCVVAAVIIQSMLPRLRRSRPERDKARRAEAKRAALEEAAASEETLVLEAAADEAAHMEPEAPKIQQPEAAEPAPEAEKAETLAPEKKKKKRPRLFEFITVEEPEPEPESAPQPAETQPEPAPELEPEPEPKPEPKPPREKKRKKEQAPAPKAERTRAKQPPEKKKKSGDDGEAGFDKVF